MAQAPSSRAVRYGAAVAAVALAVAVKALLGPALLPATYATFYLAVVFSAWFGGLGPGLLSSVMSALAGAYWLAPLLTADKGGILLVRGGLFLGVATLTSVIGGRLRSMHESMQRLVAQRTAELSDTNRRLQQEVARSQQAAARFQTAFRNAPIGMALVRPDGFPLQVNNALGAMLGYSEQELLAKSVADVTHPDDMPVAQEQVRRLLAGEIESYQVEKRYLHKRGHIVWALLNASLARGENGEPLHVISQVQDISEQKRAAEVLRKAHEELEARVEERTRDLRETNRQFLDEILRRRQVEEQRREAEARYRSLVEQLPAITYVLALDDVSTTRYISPQLQTMLGFSPAEWMADPDLWNRQIHPDDLQRVLAGVAHSHATGEPFVREYRMLTRGGEVRWFSDQSVVVRGRDGRFLFSQGVMVDITTRKQAEEELEKLHGRITGLLEGMTAGFVAVDRQWRVTYLNLSAARIAQLNRDATLGKNVWEVFPESVGTVLYERSHRVMRERVVSDTDLYYPSLNRWLRVHSYPISDGVCTLFEDVTERHAREVATVGDILQALNAHLDVRNAFPSVATGLQALTGCDFSGLALFDDRQLWAEVAALDPTQSLPHLTPRMKLSELPAASDVLAGKPYVIQDMALDPGSPIVRSIYQQGYRSSVSLPLRVSDGISGMLSLVWREPGMGSMAQLPVLNQIARALGLAVEKTQLFEEVRAGRERLQALSRRLMEVQEAERRHIARELHDEIGQHLTGLKLVLDAAGRLPAERASHRLGEAHQLVNDLIERTRHLSLDLRPAMLDDFGLLPAFLWLFDRFADQTAVQVSFEHRGLDQRFAPEVETGAYRIVQEALTNVARYAGVSEVGVRAWTEDSVLKLLVVDHGAGFDPDGTDSHGSSGIFGMRERALLLGGRIVIQSSPGVGTRLSAELPLDGGAVAGG